MVLPMILWAGDGAGSDGIIAIIAVVRRTSFVLVAFVRPESEVAPAPTASHYVISMTDAGRPSPYRHWTNASRKLLEAA